MGAAKKTQSGASFRDPSGFVYIEGDTVFRQVNRRYQADYDLLMQSGLYTALTEKRWLIPHTELAKPTTPEAYKIITPTRIPFISYPYEWCFSQLRDAALLTLNIQRLALEKGMSLKDASAYNIQFFEGKPILIDTLSFEKYPENKPWVAYRQFCEHFLAPLALMAFTDIRLGTLSERYLDGIPLDLASKLLPSRTRFSLGLGSHLYLHARSQKKHEMVGESKATYRLTLHQQLAILQSLESTIRHLPAPKQQTEWGEYYENTNYSEKAQTEKKEIIRTWIKKAQPKTAWDAGANDGSYSRLASSQGIFTLATDIDPQAVENGYREQQKHSDPHLLPLIIDLTNPSPAIGWGNTEREAFLDRLQVDLTFCLAFIHHLAISNNLPLGHLAKLFSEHSQYLIIEFVPKDDSKVQHLLVTREDIFTDYTEKGFLAAFTPYFAVIDQKPVKDSERKLFFMKRT